MNYTTTPTDPEEIEYFRKIMKKVGRKPTTVVCRELKKRGVKHPENINIVDKQTDWPITATMNSAVLGYTFASKEEITPDILLKRFGHYLLLERYGEQKYWEKFSNDREHLDEEASSLE